MGRLTDDRTTQWILRSPQADGWQTLSREYNLHPLVARVLARRGYTEPEDVETFLNPSLRRMHDPGTMADMDLAVEAAVAALDANASIVVHGDYDVDGLTSTALLVEFLSALGADVDFLIPHRIDDGYGVTGETIGEIAEAGCDLLITADCGVTAFEEIAEAREAGMEVIVIDHHSVPDQFPNATAILNPHRDDCDFPFDGLSAAGVTFNFLVALRAGLRERGTFSPASEPDLKESLDLVALGTVADVVPLVDENRIFVHRGLQKINERPRPGIRALLDAVGSEGKVTTNTIGYKVAPRINAAGRIADATECVELMVTGDRRRAREIARRLDDLNDERRELQSRLVEEAREQVHSAETTDEGLLVVDGEDWHRGVLGIVAGRLSDDLHRPVVALAREDGTAQGSARSVDGVDIVELLEQVEDVLERFGGHAAAAGLSMAVEDLEAFRRRAGDELEAMLDGQSLPRPSIEVDERISLGNLDRRFIRDLRRLRPFGAANPEPVLVCEEVRAKSARIVGDDHLKGEFTDGTGQLEGIGFSMGDQMTMLEEPVAAAFVPRWSVFRGRGQLELHLRDLRRPSSALFAGEGSSEDDR